MRPMSRECGGHRHVLHREYIFDRDYSDLLSPAVDMEEYEWQFAD